MKSNYDEIVDYIQCNKGWSVCLFDFTYKNRVPDYFAFSVDSRSIDINYEYFYQDYINKEIE